MLKIICYLYFVIQGNEELDTIDTGSEEDVTASGDVATKSADSGEAASSDTKPTYIAQAGNDVNAKTDITVPTPAKIEGKYLLASSENIESYLTNVTNMDNEQRQNNLNTTRTDAKYKDHPELIQLFEINKKGTIVGTGSPETEGPNQSTATYWIVKVKDVQDVTNEVKECTSKNQLGKPCTFEKDVKPSDIGPVFRQFINFNGNLNQRLMAIGKEKALSPEELRTEYEKNVSSIIKECEDKEIGTVEERTELQTYFKAIDDIIINIYSENTVENNKIKIKEAQAKILETNNKLKNYALEIINVAIVFVKDENVSTSNNLVQSAHAADAAKLNIETLAYTSQKIQYNLFGTLPTVKIEKIERDINNDGNVDEKTETLNSPLNENGFPLESLGDKINDNEYLAKNQYFEVYEDTSESQFDSNNPLAKIHKYKEKLYPGDKIFLSAMYNNDTAYEFNKVDIFVGVDALTNKSIEKWNVWDDQGELKTTKLVNLHKRFYKYIFPSEKKEIKYWVQLKDKIEFDTKSIKFFSGIGNEKYQTMVYEKTSDGKIDYLDRDLFGFVEGRVERANKSKMQYIPRAHVELLSQQNDKGDYDVLPSTKELLKEINKVAKTKLTDYVNNHYTFYDFDDEDNQNNGKFSIEFNRKKDFPYDNKIKIKLTFKDYKETINPDKTRTYDINDYSIAMYKSNESDQDRVEGDLKDENLLFLRTEDFDISQTKITALTDKSKSPPENKIKVEAVPNAPIKWEYPSEADDYTRAVAASEIYSDYEKTEAYLLSNHSLFQKNFPKVQTALYNGSKISHIVNKTTKHNFIEISKNIWNGSAGVFTSPQSHLHEFSHSIMYFLIENMPNKSYDENCSNCPPDKIPYLSIEENHYGFLNDYSSDSLNEGFADFMAVMFNRIIDSSFGKWRSYNWDGEETANYNVLYPYIYTDTPLIPAQSYKNVDSLHLQETAVAEFFKELITGTPPNYASVVFPWVGFRSSELIYPPPSDGAAALDNIFIVLANSKPQTFGQFYEAMKSKVDPGALDGLAIYHAFYHDTNCNMCYDKGEDLGKAAQDQGMDINLWWRKEDGTRTGIKGQIGPRYWRELTPQLTGANLKVLFHDQSGSALNNTKINVKYVFDPPYEIFNYESQFEKNNDELLYLALPFVYQTKAVVTVENSSDYMVIDSEKYWGAINTGMFNYFAEKTFTVNNENPPSTEETLKKVEPGPTPESSPFPQPTSTPSSTATPTPSPSPTVSAPSLTIADNDQGNKATSVGGGETVNVVASGFDESEKVDVYISDKKVAENIPLVSDSFGLKVDVPNNIGLGNKTIKLLGNTGQQAETEIKITSNKWFNKYTLFFASIIIFMIAMMIFAYRVIKQYLVDKTHLIKPIGTIIIIVFTATIGLVIFSSIKTFAALTSQEYAALNKTTMENIKGFIRLPKSPNYERQITNPQNPDLDYQEQWGKSKTICFLQRLSKAWLDLHSDEKLTIGDISLSGGGQFSPHQTHQNGLAFDIWSKSTTPQMSYPNNTNNSNWKPKLAQEFIDLVNNLITEFDGFGKNSGGQKIFYFACKDRNGNSFKDEKGNLITITGVTCMDDHTDHFHIELAN